MQDQVRPQPQTKEQIEAELARAEEEKIAWMASQYSVAMVQEYGVNKAIQVTGTSLAQIIANEIKPESFDQALNKVLADVHKVARACLKIRQEKGR